MASTSAGDSDTGVSTLIADAESLAAAEGGPQIIVIGSGPVGMRLVAEILRRQPLAKVHVFGNEPFEPYNRVQLSALLAGEVSRGDISLGMPDPQVNPHFQFTIAAVSKVDTQRREIVDALGQCYPFDRLVFATGARAHIPNIPGVEQAGVYTFRSMKDTEALYSRVASARHVVVVGGGLLGLEAARGLLRFNTKVTLIQQGSQLMNQQLDEEAGSLLQASVEALGIRVIVNAGVREICGKERVTHVKTRDGDVITCDTVLLCTGIKPNIELARDAWISVGRGIVVDDALRTSAEDVFAIGECCEHGGKTYGLVGPGFEQAAVVADVLTGGKASYSGSITVSRLKVVGESVVSMGDLSEEVVRPRQRTVTYRQRKQGIYRKLIVYKGALDGAVGIGDWPEMPRLQEAYKSARRIWLWQLWLFKLTGRLWSAEDANDVFSWPATAVVCQCNGITQGQLLAACVQRGCDSVESLRRCTGAGTVCGSCTPLLADLTGVKTKLEKVKGWLPLLLAGLAAICVVLVLTLTPAAPVSDSVQTIGVFESLWNDKGWKQVTGFTLLGLVLIGLMMSLRKRLQWRWLGDFSGWRVLHSVLGVASISLLIVHTGFHAGENLNFLLLSCFLGVMFVGGLASIALGFSHRLPPSLSRRLTRSINLAHLLVTWPLPVLIAVHILTVYYF